MGQTILTPKQLKFLEFIQKEPQITKRFYLTGGTPLAEFYLKHRLSEDLDFFCEKEEINPRVIDAYLKKVSPKLLVSKIKRSQFLGLISYQLVFKDKQELKVDFNYYPFPRIEKGIKYKNLEVDSVYDIAVNKLHTLFMKPRNRDYVDLYFIMAKFKYPLQKLIADAKAKFDWDIDPVNLANQFLRVKDIEYAEFPKMLVPLDKKTLESFFFQQAKLLEKRVFE